jgi:NAD(P)-dependent dehydrogenase (short-subunit alcohol dehydrogenase family)
MSSIDQSLDPLGAASRRVAGDQEPEPDGAQAAGRFDVRDRRVLVTGAAHGLGFATATAFAAAGARVVALDVDAAALERVARAHSLAGTVAADLTADQAVATAAARALELLGGLDVLVNAAAQFPVGTLTSSSATQMLEAVDINAGGLVRIVGETVGALRESAAGGRVIAFTSVVYLSGTPPAMGAYIISKAAIVGATRALARELGPDGITVNAIAPGAFPTRTEKSMVTDQERFDRGVLAQQSLKRRGQVEDIACAALFLGSDAASFITGQTLVVDGGVFFL